MDERIGVQIGGAACRMACGPCRDDFPRFHAVDDDGLPRLLDGLFRKVQADLRFVLGGFAITVIMHLNEEIASLRQEPACSLGNELHALARRPAADAAELRQLSLLGRWRAETNP